MLASTSYSSLGAEAPARRLGAACSPWRAGAPTGERGHDRARARTGGRSGARRWSLPDDPLAVLRDLVALYDDGLREPLPVATGASHAYADRRRARRARSRRRWRRRARSGTACSATARTGTWRTCTAAAVLRRAARRTADDGAEGRPASARSPAGCGRRCSRRDGGRAVTPASTCYGPLPTGTTVLEASAGTGKTWTIAALATRYVAEGARRLSELMLATFSRAATQELRERVRRAAHLDRARRSPTRRRRRPRWSQHLRDCTPSEVALRRHRLAHALSEFDAATIATTHSFCQQVLDGLGMAGDHEPGVTMVESVDDLLREVVDDLYLRKYAAHERRRRRSSRRRTRARSPAPRSATGRRGSSRRTRRPTTAPGPAGRAWREAARDELERRKRLTGVRDFDDLLVLLRDVLADPARGRGGLRAAARALPRRARRRVPGHRPGAVGDPAAGVPRARALVLIGDPKQAIYAFRGAEVLSYLDAVSEADRHETLGTNWRSDDGLLRALRPPVRRRGARPPATSSCGTSTPSTRTSRLPGEVPLRLRVLDRTGAGPLGKTGYPGDRRRCARRSPTTSPPTSSGCSIGGAALRRRRPAAGAPRRHRRAGAQARARAVRAGARSTRAGVPCVVSSSTSVFATQSARDWLWLLQALEQPHRAGRVRLAALTPLLGWTAARLDADRRRRARRGRRPGARVRARRFEEAGLAAVFERLAAQTRLESRLLVAGGGGAAADRPAPRRAGAQPRRRRGVARAERARQLAGRAGRGPRQRQPVRAQPPARDRRRRRADRHRARQQGPRVPRRLRAVRLGRREEPEAGHLLLHDPDGARVLDVGGKGGPGWDARKEQAEAEDAGEELRLLYVALTRAQCQVVAWWAPSAAPRPAPLHRLLLGRTPASPRPRRGPRCPRTTPRARRG